MVSMFSIAAWNIRGLNPTPKQNEVTDVVCAVLESHVTMDKLGGICNKVFPRWDWLSNANTCVRGTRILLGWDSDVVNVMVLAMTDQVVHCLIDTIEGNNKFFISFIYANNNYFRRRLLWRDLSMHKGFVGNYPWVMMGDFNASLYLDDSSVSTLKITLAMREFSECVESLRMTDVNQKGLRYTWNQRPNATTGLLKKIDRVMENNEFISKYSDSYAVFQPYRILDHSPAILKIPMAIRNRPRTFKFCNFVIHKPDFQNVVSKGWKKVVEGHNMYKVVKKMRFLKKPLRKLMWCNGDLHERVVKLRDSLNNAQRLLDANPYDMQLRMDENQCLQKYNNALLD
ncbi:uncharacterized protein [Rutidosis leptorrhynchoides]|uniref:uncharacterized protein n=1 Tax=Rutidosis leptorrhynchoides TaxID=125765 RepID=UPI003A99E6FA